MAGRQAGLTCGHANVVHNQRALRCKVVHAAHKVLPQHTSSQQTACVPSTQAHLQFRKVIGRACGDQRERHRSALGHDIVGRLVQMRTARGTLRSERIRTQSMLTSDSSSGIAGTRCTGSIGRCSKTTINIGITTTHPAHPSNPDRKMAATASCTQADEPHGKETSEWYREAEDQ